MLDSDTFETEIQQNAQHIALLATQMNDKYTIRSGIEITAAGIVVSGSQYVDIQSGGWFHVTTGNFGIETDSSTYVIWSGAASGASAPFWVKKNGDVKATSGQIGGFTLAANSMSSGSGTTYMNLNSNASNTYAIWAGAEVAANAPFRLKRDGTVYLTSLIAIAEDGTESTVNLRTAGLWKLNYSTIKTYGTDSGGYCTSITLSSGTVVNFNTAATARANGWAAAYSKVSWPQLGTSNTIKFEAPSGAETDTPNYQSREYKLVRDGQYIALQNGGLTFAQLFAYSKSPSWSHSMVTATVVSVSCSVDGYTYTTQFSV